MPSLTVTHVLVSARAQANAVRVIDLFHDWDTDGNGQVTLKEFTQAMQGLLNQPLKEKDLKELFGTFVTVARFDPTRPSAAA